MAGKPKYIGLFQFLIIAKGVCIEGFAKEKLV